MPLKHATKWTTFLFFSMTVVNAADSSKRITWDEFSMRVTPKNTIRMVLPDGTQIEGKPLQVKPDAMDMQITSASKGHPTGNATIPRESVSVVQVRSPRHLGKLVGTLVPLAAGAAVGIGGVAASQGSDDVYGYAIVGGAIMGLGAPGGFFAGRAVDRRFEQFIIIPARQSAANQ